MKIIKLTIGGIVIKGYIKNGLYQLTEFQLDTTFISRGLEDPNYEVEAIKAVDQEAKATKAVNNNFK